MTSDQVRWFKDIRAADIASVGGKNAWLGEMSSSAPTAGRGATGRIPPSRCRRCWRWRWRWR